MTRREALPPGVLNLVGVVLLALGWLGASGRVTLRAQAPYLNLAVAGILLAGIGNALYLMAQRRSLEQRLGQVHDRITVSLGDTPRPPGAATARVQP